MAIFKYIKGFDNPRRRHSAPGWKSPVPLNGKYCTKNSCLTTWLHPSSEAVNTPETHPVQACFCEKLLFFQSSVIQQVFGVFTGAFGVDQLFQRGFLIGGDNFNVG